MVFKSRILPSARLFLILALLGSMIGVIPPDRAQAASLLVTNTNDSGAGSLRDAILNAVPGDIITFDPSLAGQTIALSSNLVINKNLTVDGSGLSPQLTISGGSAFHLEFINSAAVMISDLTISDGYTSGNGGAIVSNGNLTLINTTLRNNFAEGFGGAIYTSSLTLKNTTIYQNRAYGSGGAIAISGGSKNIIVTARLRKIEQEIWEGHSSYRAFLMWKSSIVHWPGIMPLLAPK